MKELRSIGDIDFTSLVRDREYYPSPDDWEDQVIYFLMADRFSDGNENDEALYDAERDYELVKKSGKEEDWQSWGKRWNGGTLTGVLSKLDYLQQLGITAVWISPIFKQVSFQESYHGYGIQNFLAIDPHLGSDQDLKFLAQEAHKQGMRVILDIIINHSGDVFAYEKENTPWTGEQYPVKGYRNAEGKPEIPYGEGKDRESVWPDGAVWPREMQYPSAYYRKGYIQNWENYPEYVEGDFFSLKTHNLGTGGSGEEFQPSPALKTITEAYKYWIAYADVDGFRIDTVKHMEWGATRYFVREIHEFAKSLGKKNFYLIGEITGGLEYAIKAFKETGLNAALGINRIPNQLEGCAKGAVNPEDYFAAFSNSQLPGDDDNRWYQDNVVTMFDDHDMVSLEGDWKYRFAADKETAPLLLNALFLNVMGLGIPCIYYGTEQGFDGGGGEDSYIRECMFAGNFGAFRTQGKHFFNTANLIYVELAKLLKLRHSYLILRQGRQYLRPISHDGERFDYPRKIGEGRITSVVAWARIFNTEEAVLAFNTDMENALTVSIAVDSSLHTEGDEFQLLYSSDPGKSSERVKVEQAGDNLAVKVEVPPAGCLMLYRGTAS
ncbi:alpha-amylase [Marispirochaeta aestuarii]|uniref:Alpha-amylase n=1 Tax=Marispirochaeta aestuarii TaxID=1963862 RepID=A0A1Y1RVJ9_9SPIO|nr:alpha-amylase family glycosyl hydrolase [Marispirochaeta aestuarii]ORC34052.1 alpha-amylase [Marispirochaeta aestuarii]